MADPAGQRTHRPHRPHRHKKGKQSMRHQTGTTTATGASASPARTGDTSPLELAANSIYADHGQTTFSLSQDPVRRSRVAPSALRPWCGLYAHGSSAEAAAFRRGVEVASCYEDDVLTACAPFGGAWVVLVVDLDAEGGVQEREDFRQPQA